MSQKWVDKEYVVRIADIEPGATSFTDIVIRPGSRPFRVEAVIADDSAGFGLVQCVVGKKLLVGKKPVTFPLTGAFAVADPGCVITVQVENTSGEKMSFKGKLVGKELV